MASLKIVAKFKTKNLEEIKTADEFTEVLKCVIEHPDSRDVFISNYNDWAGRFQRLWNDLNIMKSEVLSAFSLSNYFRFVISCLIALCFSESIRMENALYSLIGISLILLFAVINKISLAFLKLPTAKSVNFIFQYFASIEILLNKFKGRTSVTRRRFNLAMDSDMHNKIIVLPLQKLEMQNISNFCFIFFDIWYNVYGVVFASQLSILLYIFNADIFVVLILCTFASLLTFTFIRYLRLQTIHDKIKRQELVINIMTNDFLKWFKEDCELKNHIQDSGLINYDLLTLFECGDWVKEIVLRERLLSFVLLCTFMEGNLRSSFDSAKMNNIILFILYNKSEKTSYIPVPPGVFQAANENMTVKLDCNEKKLSSQNSQNKTSLMSAEVQNNFLVKGQSSSTEDSITWENLTENIITCSPQNSPEMSKKIEQNMINTSEDSVNGESANSSEKESNTLSLPSNDNQLHIDKISLSAEVQNNSPIENNSTSNIDKENELASNIDYYPDSLSDISKNNEQNIPSNSCTNIILNSVNNSEAVSNTLNDNLNVIASNDNQQHSNEIILFEEVQNNTPVGDQSAKKEDIVDREDMVANIISNCNDDSPKMLKNKEKNISISDIGFNLKSENFSQAQCLNSELSNNDTASVTTKSLTKVKEVSSEGSGEEKDNENEQKKNLSTGLMKAMHNDCSDASFGDTGLSTETSPMENESQFNEAALTHTEEVQKNTFMGSQITNNENTTDETNSMGNIKNNCIENLQKITKNDGENINNSGTGVNLESVKSSEAINDTLRENLRSNGNQQSSFKDHSSEPLDFSGPCEKSEHSDTSSAAASEVPEFTQMSAGAEVEMAEQSKSLQHTHAVGICEENKMQSFTGAFPSERDVSQPNCAYYGLSSNGVASVTTKNLSKVKEVSCEGNEEEKDIGNKQKTNLSKGLMKGNNAIFGETGLSTETSPVENESQFSEAAHTHAEEVQKDTFMGSQITNDENTTDETNSMVNIKNNCNENLQEITKNEGQNINNSGTGFNVESVKSNEAGNDALSENFRSNDNQQSSFKDHSSELLDFSGPREKSEHSEASSAASSEMPEITQMSSGAEVGMSEQSQSLECTDAVRTLEKTVAFLCKHDISQPQWVNNGVTNNGAASVMTKKVTKVKEVGLEECEEEKDIENEKKKNLSTGYMESNDANLEVTGVTLDNFSTETMPMENENEINEAVTKHTEERKMLKNDDNDKRYNNHLPLNEKDVELNIGGSNSKENIKGDRHCDENEEFSRVTDCTQFQIPVCHPSKNSQVERTSEALIPTPHTSLESSYNDCDFCDEKKNSHEDLNHLKIPLIELPNTTYPTENYEYPRSEIEVSYENSEVMMSPDNDAFCDVEMEDINWKKISLQCILYALQNVIEIQEKIKSSFAEVHHITETFRSSEGNERDESATLDNMDRKSVESNVIDSDKQMQNIEQLQSSLESLIDSVPKVISSSDAYRISDNTLKYSKSESCLDILRYEYNKIPKKHLQNIKSQVKNILCIIENFMLSKDQNAKESHQVHEQNYFTHISKLKTEIKNLDQLIDITIPNNSLLIDGESNHEIPISSNQIDEPLTKETSLYSQHESLTESRHMFEKSTSAFNFTPFLPLSFTADTQPFVHSLHHVPEAESLSSSNTEYTAYTDLLNMPLSSKIAQPLNEEKVLSSNCNLNLQNKQCMADPEFRMPFEIIKSEGTTNIKQNSADSSVAGQQVRLDVIGKTSLPFDTEVNQTGKKTMDGRQVAEKKECAHIIPSFMNEDKKSQENQKQSRTQMEIMKIGNNNFIHSVSNLEDRINEPVTVESSIFSQHEPLSESGEPIVEKVSAALISFPFLPSSSTEARPFSHISENVPEAESMYDTATRFIDNTNRSNMFSVGQASKKSLPHNKLKRTSSSRRGIKCQNKQPIPAYEFSMCSEDMKPLDSTYVRPTSVDTSASDQKDIVYETDMTSLAFESEIGQREEKTMDGRRFTGKEESCDKIPFVIKKEIDAQADKEQPKSQDLFTVPDSHQILKQSNSTETMNIFKRDKNKTFGTATLPPVERIISPLSENLSLYPGSNKISVKDNNEEIANIEARRMLKNYISDNQLEGIPRNSNEEHGTDNANPANAEDRKMVNASVREYEKLLTDGKEILAIDNLPGKIKQSHKNIKKRICISPLSEDGRCLIEKKLSPKHSSNFKDDSFMSQKYSETLVLINHCLKLSKTKQCTLFDRNNASKKRCKKVERVDDYSKRPIKEVCEYNEKREQTDSQRWKSCGKDEELTKSTDGEHPGDDSYWSADGTSEHSNYHFHSSTDASDSEGESEKGYRMELSESMDDEYCVNTTDCSDFCNQENQGTFGSKQNNHTVWKSDLVLDEPGQFSENFAVQKQSHIFENRSMEVNTSEKSVNEKDDKSLKYRLQYDNIHLELLDNSPCVTLRLECSSEEDSSSSIIENEGEQSPVKVSGSESSCTLAFPNERSIETGSCEAEEVELFKNGLILCANTSEICKNSKSSSDVATDSSRVVSKMEETCGIALDESQSTSTQKTRKRIKKRLKSEDAISRAIRTIKREDQQTANKMFKPTTTTRYAKKERITADETSDIPDGESHVAAISKQNSLVSNSLVYLNNEIICSDDDSLDQSGGAVSSIKSTNTKYFHFELSDQLKLQFRPKRRSNNVNVKFRRLPDSTHLTFKSGHQKLFLKVRSKPLGGKNIVNG